MARKKQYYIITDAPVLSGAIAYRFQFAIKNLELFRIVMSKKARLKYDYYDLISVSKHDRINALKIWVKPAPEHAIVAARLKGLI